MSIDGTYRLAREDDLSAMRLVQSTALYDLIVTRGGREPSAMPITDEPSSEMRHLLRTDPKLAWVAIEDGRTVGFSVGFVRRELWFLADLFMLPGPIPAPKSARSASSRRSATSLPRVSGGMAACVEAPRTSSGPVRW